MAVVHAHKDVQKWKQRKCGASWQLGMARVLLGESLRGWPRRCLLANTVVESIFSWPRMCQIANKH